MRNHKPYKVTTESVANTSNLCRALDISIEDLRKARSMQDSDRYTTLRQPKLNGEIRVVNNPHHLIRKIQRRLNKRFFANHEFVRWPYYIYGCIPNYCDENGDLVTTDYVSCASKHCQSKSVLKLDISDFFGNVHCHHVFNVFNDLFKFPKDVSEVLTDMCTLNGALPQGGLTSSYLASLCLYDKEGDVVQRIERKGLVYTRLIDDITISSRVANYNFDYAKKLYLICWLKRTCR